MKSWVCGVNFFLYLNYVTQITRISLASLTRIPQEKKSLENQRSNTGTVTAVMGDTATVDVEGKTVDRYVNELWLMSHDKLQSMNVSEYEYEDHDDEPSNLIPVNCKGGKTVDVTPEQHAYLVKTFTEPVLATMVPEAIEVIVEDLENLESPLSGSETDDDSSESFEPAEDDYTSPYFKDITGGLTYFDLDRLGISPNDLMHMRAKQKHAKELEGDLEGAASIAELSAADLILQEKQKEIEIRIEEKKIENKQTCTFFARLHTHRKKLTTPTLNRYISMYA